MQASKRPRPASSPLQSQNLGTEQNEEFHALRSSTKIHKELQCPICLGILRKTRTVMEYLHRFCKECIEATLRLGKRECPVCRTHCASRRALRDDTNIDSLIAAMYPEECGGEVEAIELPGETAIEGDQLSSLHKHISEGETAAKKKVEELQLQVTQFQLQLAEAHENLGSLHKDISELETINQEHGVRLQELGRVNEENSRLLKESKLSMQMVSEQEQKIAELEAQAMRFQVPCIATDLGFSHVDWSKWPLNPDRTFFSKLAQFVCKSTDKGSLHLPQQALEVVDFFLSKEKIQAAEYVPYNSLDRYYLNNFEVGLSISPAVISCWAKILNTATMGGIVKTKLFLEAIQLFETDNIITGTDVTKMWTEWLRPWYDDIPKVELVFLPVTINFHSFLLVVNFNKEQIQYLDCHIKRHDPKGWEQYSRELVRILKKVLVAPGHRSASKVSQFEWITVIGEWRMKSRSQMQHLQLVADSGVCVMHFMESFTGEPDFVAHCNFFEEAHRNYLRARLCAEIVMDASNLNLEKLLSQVPRFIEEKKRGKHHVYQL